MLMQKQIVDELRAESAQPNNYQSKNEGSTLYNCREIEVEIDDNAK
jgi:hypothetical protein